MKPSSSPNLGRLDQFWDRPVGGVP
jgi:hypothetical protein